MQRLIRVFGLLGLLLAYSIGGKAAQSPVKTNGSQGGYSYTLGLHEKSPIEICHTVLSFSGAKTQAREENFSCGEFTAPVQRPGMESAYLFPPKTIAAGKHALHLRLRVLRL